jgi:predicted nicotinamide N-methyase
MDFVDIMLTFLVLKVRNKRVLELGSGCGLVGIAAAMVGAKEVVMTDLQYSLPLMRENVLRNKSAYDKTTFLSCKECDWFNPSEISTLFHSTSDDKNNESYPDVILVADCVWLSSLVTPLLQTLKKYTTNPSTKVIITYQQRVSHSVACIKKIYSLRHMHSIIMTLCIALYSREETCMKTFGKESTRYLMR